MRRSGADETWQEVFYSYTFWDGIEGGYALSDVRYPGAFGPGGIEAHATYSVPPRYTYSSVTSALFSDPLFAGPLTQVHYNFGRIFRPGCTQSYNPNDYWPAGPVSEVRDGGSDALISKLEFSCSTPSNPGFQSLASMQRYETRGDGGFVRTFYYGQAGGADPGSSFHYENNNGYPVYVPPEANPTYNGFITLAHHLGRVTDWQNDYNRARYFRYRQNGTIWREFEYLGFITEANWTSFPHHVTQIKHPDASSRNFDYSNPGGSAAIDSVRIPYPYEAWTYSKTDERGFVTTYTRDSLRRVAQVSHPSAGGNEFFNYDALNRVTSHTMVNGTIVTYDYTIGAGNPYGQLAKVTNSAEGEDERVEYTYYAAGAPGGYPGLVEKVTDRRARYNGAPYTARMEYNSRHQITKVHYPATGGSADPTVTYEYDVWGNCIRVTDELGHWKRFEFDCHHRCTLMEESLNAPAWNASGTMATRKWEWSYDRFYTINGVFSGFGGETHLDPQWRVQYAPSNQADGSRLVTVRYFNEENRIDRVESGYLLSPSNTWNSNDVQVHWFTYDANGNQLTAKDPLNRITTTEYDNRNRAWRVTDPLAQQTTTSFDVANNKTQVTFPDGNNQRWQGFDGFGQPSTFIDERGNVTNLTYQWGPMKKLQTVCTHRDTDAGGTEDQWTSFYYDGLGRSTQISFPNGTYEQNWWGFGNQLFGHRTRRGHTKWMHFDARHRELQSWWDPAGSDVANVYRTWDDAGRLTQIQNDVSTVDFGYDDASQVRWEGNNITGSGGRVQTTYFRHGDGSVAHISYPNGFWLRHDFNGRGQLKTVGADDANSNWGFKIADYNYFADGKNWWTTHLNGLISSFTYDAGGRLSDTNTYRSTGGNLAYRHYDRDSRDRITSLFRGGDSAQNPRENSKWEVFNYDAEGQLVHAWYEANDVNGASALRQDLFVYDALGNRKSSDWSANNPGWYTWTRWDNGLNQTRAWAGGLPANWDDQWNLPNGNLIQDGNFSAWYNALNQPIWSLSTFSPGYNYYGYDPLGRCVKRWIGPSGDVSSNPATYLYYDGWNLIQEGPSYSSATQVYFHGARVDEIAGRYHYGLGQWYLHHFDARTNCVLVTDLGGNIAEQYAYDAFGSVYIYDGAGASRSATAIGNRFLFTGREWLANWGVYDYRHRQYHPHLGRFIQPDPKHFGAGDYNLYRYCHNDPVNKVDPTGLGESILRRRGSNRASEAEEELGRRLTENEIRAEYGFRPAQSGIDPVTGQRVIPVFRAPPGPGDRAKEIHRALTLNTQGRTTTAVTETAEGRSIVSSSEMVLRPAQRAALSDGETAVRGPGHAEVTGVLAAQRMGLTPTGVGASRPVCAECQIFLRELGIDILSPVK